MHVRSVVQWTPPRAIRVLNVVDLWFIGRIDMELLLSPLLSPLDQLGHRNRDASKSLTQASGGSCSDCQGR